MSFHCKLRTCTASGLWESTTVRAREILGFRIIQVTGQEQKLLRETIRERNNRDGGSGGETIQPKGQFGLKLYPTSLFKLGFLCSTEVECILLCLFKWLAYISFTLCFKFPVNISANYFTPVHFFKCSVIKVQRRQRCRLVSYHLENTAQAGRETLLALLLPSRPSWPF